MYFKRAVGLTAVLTLIILVGVAYAAELVNNGTFTGGTAGWTLTGSGSGTGYPGNCDPDQLYLADVASAYPAFATQCINIITHGSAWTLGLSPQSLGTDDTIQAIATFYDNTACDPDTPPLPLHISSTSITTLPIPIAQSFSFYTSASPVAGSVQILIRADDSNNNEIGICLDDVSLGADGATAVSLQSINAGQMPNLWLLIPFIILLFAATTAVIQYTNRKEAK